MLSILMMVGGLLAADAIPGVPIDTTGWTALEKVLMVGLVGSLSVVGFLFSRLEASRKMLYDDARADAKVDQDIAAALKTLLERTERKP